MRNFWRYAFVVLVAYPVMYLWLGFRVHHRERLATAGPAIIAANHNSHLDTLALLALFPLRRIPQVRPVAAADYFLRSGPIAWLSRELVGIVAVERNGHAEGSDPLEECHAALDRDEILLMFPEGTRGEPERMTEFKTGIARLAARHADAQVVAVFMHGLGKSLPKGSVVPLPLCAELMLGTPFRWNGSCESFMAKLRETFDSLRAELRAPDYT